MLSVTACSNKSPKQPEDGNGDAPIPEIQFRITWDSFSGRGESVKVLVESYNDSPTRKAHVTLIGGNENSEEDRKSVV